ncbi:Phage-related minor tail protein [Azotobacter beijerinckii]|uniref:Phage-related minor tail protein n=1 Tax=Azotobacter beijerinckii TaxID=170623 RepID=A0A1H9MND8_9GAMM|nr:phage tail tape measure protein [Azotobacter beijerinckii]SER25220.1 Phage-related minor tail protein [Azotobacter beijerinckii]
MARDLRLEVILQAVDRATRPIRAVSQGGSELAQTLKQTREALRGLQGQQKDVESFRAVQAASKQTSEAIRANRERIKALSEQMAAAARPTRQMTTEFQRAMREGHKLKASYSEQQRQLQSLQTRLNSAGIQTNRLGAEELRLRRRVEQSTRSIAEQQDGMRRLAQQQERLAKAKAAYEKSKEVAGKVATAGSVALAAGGGAMASMGSQAFANQQLGAKTAAQFGQGAAEAKQYRAIINSVYSGGTGDSLEQVAEALSAVGGGFGSLGKLGAGQLEALTKRATTLANTFDLDVAESVQMASIMIQNGLARDATEAFDLMAGGMQNVSVSLRQELPEIVHEYATNFRALGFNGKEAMNLLVSAAGQGKFALDKTGDALKEFTLRGSDMSKGSQEAYKEIGLNAQKMSTAIAKGGPEARGALMKTVKGLLAIKDPATRANTAIALFGTPLEDLSVDQIPQFLKGLASVEDRLGEVTGATDRMGDTLGDNAGSALIRLQRMLSGELMTVLDAFEGDILAATKAVTGWFKANPELANTLVKVAVAVAALAAVGGGLTIILAGLVGPLAMVKLGLATLGISAGVAMGPVLLIIAAIAALAAGAYLVWQNWGTLGPKFAALWEGIKSQFASLMTWFASLPERFRQFGADILQGLANGITGALGSVKEAITGAGDKAIGWFKAKLGIHSPSRVFAQLGGFTMQGLEQGLVAGQGGPLQQVTDLAKRLTAAGTVALGVTAGASPAAAALPQLQEVPMATLPEQMQQIRYRSGDLPRPDLPALTQQLQVTFADLPRLEALLLDGPRIDSRPPLAASTATPITVQGDTIQITIQAAPGGNPADLAQQINRILDERERTKASRVRSRLHDQE